MNFSQPLSLLIPKVCAHAERLLERDVKIAQYRFGFYRLPLTVGNGEEGLALQIWLRELPSEQFPHVHNYTTRARILNGELTRHLWDVRTDADGPYQTVEEICHNSTWRDSAVAERVSAHCVESRKFKPGDVYEIPFGQIHSSTINSFPTVTIVEKTGFKANMDPIHYAPVESNGAPSKEFNLFEDYDNEKARCAILKVLRELSPGLSISKDDWQFDLPLRQAEGGRS